jgi:hypothetical protein
MGLKRTANKQRWNEKNYAQIKVSVKPHIAKAFKDQCLARGESQASVLSRLMSEYSEEDPPEEDKTASKKATDGDKYDTRRKRRKIVSGMLSPLECVLEAEEGYRDNIPSAFTSRYETAENAVERLSTALENLQEAYTTE